jgi:hypothetical protein
MPKGWSIKAPEGHGKVESKSRAHDLSFNHSRSRGFCFGGTFIHSGREIRSTRVSAQHSDSVVALEHGRDFYRDHSLGVS